MKITYRRLRLQLEQVIAYKEEEVFGEMMKVGYLKEFSPKARHFIQEFKSKYRAYLKKGTEMLDECEFIFREQDVNFEDIFSLLLMYKGEVSCTMYMETIYEKKDFDQAAAYLIGFSKWAYYYDDEEGPFNSIYISCEECACRDHRKNVYIRPGGVKKNFSSKFAGADTPYSLEIVSPMLRDYLLENKIEEEYFKEALQKRGDLLGYYLNGGDHLIPSMSLLSDETDWLTICPKCGRKVIKMSERWNQESLWGQFREKGGFGSYPVSTKWEMPPNIVKALGAVNFTEDYFNCMRYTVINKNLFSLIRAKIPNVTRYTTPIFEADFEATLEGELIVKSNRK